jgi:hypothetical protein
VVLVGVFVWMVLQGRFWLTLALIVVPLLPWSVTDSFGLRRAI